MKQIKILVHNIADPMGRSIAEEELAAYRNDGWEIVSSHTDFEMAAATRVMMLTIILEK